MKKVFLLFTACCWFFSGYSQYVYPFQNPGLPDDQRIDNLISLMSLDEKINCLGTQFGVPRLGIRTCRHSEGLHGMALGGPANWGGREHSPTTIFPQSYGLGETWDPELIKKVAEQESHEIRYYFQSPKTNKGSLVMRAPNADLARDPRWGRTEESFGEDAFFNAKMTVAFVKGLQGDHPKYWKSASLMKHFLANSNEDGRDSTSSNFDDRLFREYYAYPFYKGIVEGGSRAFMASYNSWNDVPMTIHPCLQEITRNEWGNNGIICTDGGALKLLVTAHKYYPDMVQAAAAVIKAGVGQFLDPHRPHVETALKRGLISESDIDQVLRGNFFVALKLGLMDGDQLNTPYTDIGVIDTIRPWAQPKVKEFVREVTAKSAVLLKNQGLLPIDKNKIKSIAVIGPQANEVLLDWYSGTPPYTVTILEGIKNAVGNNVTVNYAPSNQMDQAAIAAKKSDIAIVCVGNHVYGTDPKWKVSPVPSDGREAVDRKALSLELEDLVKVVRQANPNTVLVLVSSFPYAINWSQAHLPAILHITNNSQELGNGVADVLFGKFNPAGRTVQTWVKSIEDLPPMMDYNIRNGHTYMYFKGQALYPFGFGLSYTTFSYSNLKTSSAQFNQNTITVSIDIKNTGNRDGEEVVQLYVSYPKSKVERPVKQLKGFKRVLVKAGETRTVNIELPKEDIAYWDVEKHAFTVEPGQLNLMIGASSTDIKLTKNIQVVN